MDSYRVLITEDDPDTARLVAALLGKMGHQVCGFAPSGEEALELTARTNPDIVLMDILLGRGMSGIETAREIIARHDVPVVYLTGGGPGVVDEASLSGAHGFIQKPVSYTELAAVLRIAVHKHSMERLIRASEEKYRGLFNNAAAGIYTASSQGRFLEVNAALASFLGYESPEEMVSLVRDMDSQYYLEDGRRQEIMDRLEADGAVEGLESEVLGRDGDALWITEHCRRIPSGNGELRYQAVVIDVTARKDAEQARDTALAMLQGTVDAIPDLIFLTDMEGFVILCNEAFREHAGLDDQDILGRSCLDLLPEFRRFAADPPLSGERTTYFTDPQARFHMSMSPYCDFLDNVIGLVYVCRDMQFLDLRRKKR